MVKIRFSAPRNEKRIAKRNQSPTKENKLKIKVKVL